MNDFVKQRRTPGLVRLWWRIRRPEAWRVWRTFMPRQWWERPTSPDYDTARVWIPCDLAKEAEEIRIRLGGG